MTSLPIAIAAGLGLLCVAIGYCDLRYMRIPDWIWGATLALFVLWIVTDGAAVPVLARLITAAVIFAICFALFAARIMGGGDTKIIPALSLFVPLDRLSSIMLLFAICLFVSIGIVLVLRRWRKGRTWGVFTSNKLPMGVAIGTTGLIALVV